MHLEKLKSSPPFLFLSIFVSLFLSLLSLLSVFYISVTLSLSPTLCSSTSPPHSLYISAALCFSIYLSVSPFVLLSLHLLFICLSINLSLHLSLSLHLFLCLFICLSISLCVSPPVSLSLNLSICLSTCSYVSLTVSPSLYMSLHLSICPYLFLPVSLCLISFYPVSPFLFVSFSIFSAFVDINFWSNRSTFVTDERDKKP